MLRRSLAFNFIEEGKVGTSYVLHLLRKRAHSLELTRTRHEVIFGFRHGLRHAQELPLGPVQGSSDAVGNALGDVGLLRGRRNREQKSQQERTNQAQATTGTGRG